MKKIIMFDTSYGTQNLGDFIINNSINKQMKFLLENNFVVRYSTHTPIQKFMQNFKQNPISDFCDRSDYKFLCGTNLFKENLIHLWNDFNINIFDVKSYKNSISLGCGITKSRYGLNFYTKRIYKKILNKNVIHSVRDEQTKKFFNDLGLEAINTGCPTFWELTKNHCKKIPTKKSDKVIFTLTDYNQDYENDHLLIDILKRNYKELYIWIQGSNDLEYFNSFDNKENINIINPNISAYDDLLKQGEIDYVGTRLHAGVFAMQHFIRSIIIIIDNRARDIKENYNIISIERNNIANELENLINSDFSTDININEEAINKWKSQFINK